MDRLTAINGWDKGSPLAGHGSHAVTEAAAIICRSQSPQIDPRLGTGPPLPTRRDECSPSGRYAGDRREIERAEKEWPRGGGNVAPNYRGNGLQLEFTVKDEGVFTMPWSATITYGRDANPNWDERVCAENVQHDYDAGFYSDRDAHLPTADKADF